MASLGFIWGPTGGWRCQKHWIKFGDIWCHFFRFGRFFSTTPLPLIVTWHINQTLHLFLSAHLCALNKETSSPVIQQYGVREECEPWFRPREPVVQPPVPGRLVHQVSAGSEGVKPVSMCVWQIQEIQIKVSCVASWIRFYLGRTLKP